MKKLRLGKTELRVTTIGLGGIQITKVSEDEAVSTIKRGIDLGINLIETARGYFDSEDKIGKALKGKRKGVIIVTKAGQREKAVLAKSIDESLSSLKTDYIDLYQLHGVDNEEDYRRTLSSGGALEALEEAKKKGKILHLGLSSHSLDLARKIVKDDLFESIQIPISFINTEVEESGFLKEAREKDIGVIAMKPLGGGRLEDPGLCLKYIFSLKSVVPVVGVQSVREVEELVKIAEDPTRLRKSDFRKMEEIRKEIGSYFCRACRYCEPCPEGISIFSVLWLPVYVKQMGKQRVLSGHSLQDIEKAKNCTQCGKCEERCPFHLSIIAGLTRSITLLEKLKTKN